MAVCDVWMINPVKLDTLPGEGFEVWGHNTELQRGGLEVIGTL